MKNINTIIDQAKANVSVCSQITHYTRPTENAIKNAITATTKISHFTNSILVSG